MWVSACIVPPLCIWSTLEKDNIMKGGLLFAIPTLLPSEIVVRQRWEESGCSPLTSGNFHLSTLSFQVWSKGFECHLAVLWKTDVLKYFFLFQANILKLGLCLLFIVCANFSHHTTLGCTPALGIAWNRTLVHWVIGVHSHSVSRPTSLFKCGRE